MSSDIIQLYNPSGHESSKSHSLIWRLCSVSIHTYPSRVKVLFYSLRRLRSDGNVSISLPVAGDGEDEGGGAPLQQLVHVPAPVHRLPVDGCHNVPWPRGETVNRSLLFGPIFLHTSQLAVLRIRDIVVRIRTQLRIRFLSLVTLRMQQKFLNLFIHIFFSLLTRWHIILKI